MEGDRPSSSTLARNISELFPFLSENVSDLLNLIQELSIENIASYEEAIGLLYSEHSFAITSLGTMHRFLTTVSPQHLNLIQSLHITTIIPEIHLFGLVHPSEMPITVQIKRQETEIHWLTCCIALSRMAGLRNLEIEFWNESHQLVWGENILKGLSSVKVLGGGNFVVRLPWQDEAHVAIESKVVGGFKVEWRAFGAEPVSR
jgi:hypothetical protein